MLKNIEKLREYIILSIVYIFPLIFASTFIDTSSLPKLIVLYFLIFVTFILVILQVYLTGKLKLTYGKYDLPIFILTLAYLVSAVLITPNKMEAFFIPGNASFLLGFFVVYLMVGTIPNKNTLKLTLMASATTLSIIVMANFLGVFDKIPQLPTFIKQASFNPAGDHLTGAFFLITTLAFATWFLIKETNLTKKIVFALVVIFILIGAGMSVFTVISSINAPTDKQSFQMTNFSTDWSIAIDTIKESPLLGAGPGNYLTSFNRFRPASYNLTNLWLKRFDNARSWYLTLLTESGILGLIGISFLIYVFIRGVNRSVLTYDPVIYGVIVFSFLFLLVFPATPVNLFLLFVFLGINSQSKGGELNIFAGPTHANARLLLGVIACFLILFVALRVRPIILAEISFKRANDALSLNDGKKTYDALNAAITLNPYGDRYHASYAQVNLALARSIASNAKDPKNLSDDAKNTILQLIQQAIREGQTTVNLNPSRAANWQVLASIYQVIIPYTNQADQFAIQSYGRTIDLDPIDPNTRISLGGLYYSLGQYDNAIDVFKFAILAKPDLANAYYNLATAYAAKNDFTDAIAAINKVLTLVPKDSNDAKIAQNDLDSYQNKQKNLQQNTTNSSLTTPTKQTPVITPQLNLPEEASPPASPNVPTPSPVATTTPTATP